MIISLWIGTIVLCIGIICYELFLKEWIRRLKLIHLLPGSPQKYILGHLTDLIADRETLFNQLRHWSKTYGPLYNISASIFYPSANICGSKEFEKIASTLKHIEKSPIYLLTEKWLGKGLLTSTGSLWHSRRKILTPAFHFNILQQFVTVFNSETKRLVNALQEDSEKPCINVVPPITLFALYSITETSMGTALNINTDKSYIKAVLQIGKLLVHRLVRPWTYHPLYYYIFPSGIKEKTLIKIAHDFTKKIISEKAEKFEKFEVPSENYNYSSRKKLVFLDLLLNAKSDGDIDDEGIKDEVNTFMFEGHDTTSTSLCFTLMLLANYREYQDEIYQEIISIVGDGDKDPDINDLNDLKLLERFIKESLRLYPSVPFISRTLEEDIVVDGYLLPKQTIVNIHIYDILRNDRDWPEPEKFDPDRFLPENCIHRHPYAYVPFSAGSRNCIGQKFAILEMKSVLCGILRNFILEPIDTPESIKLVVDMVLRTENNDIKVKFTPRHKN